MHNISVDIRIFVQCMRQDGAYYYYLNFVWICQCGGDKPTAVLMSVCAFSLCSHIMLKTLHLAA